MFHEKIKHTVEFIEIVAAVVRVLLDVEFVRKDISNARIGKTQVLRQVQNVVLHVRERQIISGANV